MTYKIIYIALIFKSLDKSSFWDTGKKVFLFSAMPFLTQSPPIFKSGLTK